MKSTNRLGKWLKVSGAWTTTTLALGLATAACLSRPVGQQPPTTKVNFTSTVSQQAVDKVDILFAIDNSQSMGDKQEYLAEAVPDLLSGLLRPRCVNPETGAPFPGDTSTADPTAPAPTYGCATGAPEFKPVTDMHIGIVSSSLGNFGARTGVCDTNNGRSNDGGKLVAFNGRGATTVNALAEPNGNFLAWYPQSEDNENKTRHPDPASPILLDSELSTNFEAMVRGVGQNGCGLEAQLESMYRFLIQPDPWDAIRLDGNGQADLGEGIDYDVLKQRADFLRPDSLVAVIMLTDEDDSSADPLALNGQGWAFMDRNFPNSPVTRANNDGKTAPLPTTVCEDDPLSPDCTTCGFAATCQPADSAACQKLKQDGNCSGSSGVGTNGYYAADDDQMNVRFHNMKRRFGIDPQYPIQRYVDGLTKYTVPDRTTEHVIRPGATPDARRSIASYTQTPKCTNPLFASRLPREPGENVCELPRSTRTPDLIFFAVIGGVPHQLLYPNGYNPDDPEANRTTEDQWVKILGKSKTFYDVKDPDLSPYMVQSIDPRPGIDGNPDAPRGDNSGNAINGREWRTAKQDLQFACTFPLRPESYRNCVAGDDSCDCNDLTVATTNPPLCNGPTTQTRAKAYPTIRELMVARALGEQGIAASLCPIVVDNKDDPRYGYRPAVASIIDRLKNALTQQCLPQKLRDDDQGTAADGTALPVDCLVLAQLPLDSGGCSAQGLSEPDAEVLRVFREQQREETGAVVEGGLDLTSLPVCLIPQETVRKGDSCKNLNDKKWCYVENDRASGKSPAGRCPQALIFSAGTQDLAGARFSLQCIRQFSAGEAAGDTR